MSSFRYHVATDRQEPLPEPDELPTIEANSPEQALDHLSLRRFTGEPGQTSAWLRVELDSADDSKAADDLATDNAGSSCAR
jgi:hypothetical protein